MNAKPRLFLTCLALTSTLWAATKPIHDTDPINAPLFAKPGQTRLAVAIGQKSEGIHAHGGVALTPHFALVAATSWADLNNCMSCRISERRHVEAGLGYYAPVSATGLSREVFGGLGFGRFRMSGNDWNWDPRPEDLRVTAGHYQEAYVQANVGKTAKWMDRAGGLRLVAYHVTDFALKDGYGAHLQGEASQWGLYAEPAIILRFGFRDFKIDTQMGVSIPLIQGDAVDNNPVWVSIGMGLNLFGK